VNDREWHRRLLPDRFEPSRRRHEADFQAEPSFGTPHERPNHARPPELEEGEAIEPPPKPSDQPRIEFPNPTGSRSARRSRPRALRLAGDERRSRRTEFVEPVALSSTPPGNFRLPPTASRWSFNLVALRARRTTTLSHRRLSCTGKVRLRASCLIARHGRYLKRDPWLKRRLLGSADGRPEHPVAAPKRELKRGRISPTLGA
jgi:hypothetical protein